LRVRDVAISEKIGPPLFLAGSRERLGRLYFAEKKFPEAESQFTQALRAIENSDNSHDPVVSSLVEDLGGLYLQSGKYQDSAQFYARLLHLEEAQLGTNSPRLLPALETLSDLMRKLNRPAEAQQYDERRKKIVDEQIGRGNSPSSAKERAASVKSDRQPH
jgi:tetratricopeptide (TPR) repeat protein